MRVLPGVPIGTPRLTFDDGPGEDTEALLDVLARHGVTATFFLVGERVTQNEGLVQRIVREGHELGNHSWDHPDMRTLPLDAVRAQLVSTSDAIEGAAGVRPNLFRPPYGYTSPAIEELAESLGMPTLLWDVDTGDWDRPGVEAIGAALSGAPEGAVVLMHDGPAGREQTVAAVEHALAAALDRAPDAH